MKTSNKCPKCGKPIICQSKISKTFECLTFKPKEGDVLVQSDLCRSRCQVAKLKKQVERLKARTKSLQEWGETAEEAVSSLQKTIQTLRNPNF